MGPYYITFLLLIVGGIFTRFIPNDRWARALVCLFSWLVLVLLCSLKSDTIGTDTVVYKKMFETIGAGSWAQCFSGTTDIGYALLNKLCWSVLPSFHFFEIVFYSIVWGGLCYFAYVFSDAPQITIFVIAVFLLTFSMTALRQTLALSLFSIGMGLFSKVKKKKTSIFLFLVFFLAALSIHKASVVCILVIPLFLFLEGNSLPLFACVSIYLIALVGARSLYYSLADFVNSVYVPFTNAGLPSTSLLCFLIFVVGWLFNFSSFVVFVLPARQTSVISVELGTRLPNNLDASVFQKTKNFFLSFHFCLYSVGVFSDKRKTEMRFFLALTLLCGCIMAFALASSVFGRIYCYFISGAAVVVGNTINNRSKKTIRIIGELCVYLLAILYFVISIHRSGYLSDYVPYLTWF